MAPAAALIGRLPSLLSAFVGAGLLAQFPAFFQQYLQSLGGRLDQAELQEARVLAAAERHGLTVEGYLTRFAEELGFLVMGVIASPLLGPAGNKELLAHLKLPV